MTDNDATGGESGRSTVHNRRQKVLGGVLIVVAAGCAVAVLASQWSDVRDGLSSLSVGGVGIAAIASIVSVAASFLAWRATLAGLGSPLPVTPAARIFFVGQLGKYVPGSVWAIVGQMELGRAAGVRRDRMATAGLLVLAISLAVALGLGALAAPALVEAGGSGYALLVLLVVPLAVVLHPRVLGPLLDRVFRRLRRPPLEHRPDGRTIVEVAALSVISNGLLGVQVWALATDVGATGWRVLPLAVGGYALAAAAGLLAIPVPAGAGVRELVLVLSLSPVLDVGGATLVALLSRVLLTVTDLATATAAGAVGRPR
jgi:uncharacterized membrane protein YbhN (UPF0104 family)